jgi:hypothetical protein
MDHQMRRYTIYAAAVSAAALSLYGLSAGSATAGSSAGTKAVAHSSTAVSGKATPFAGTLCKTTETGKTWTQDGITAQNGAPTNPSLNTFGGKQVKCKGGATVNTVVVDGYPNQGAAVNKFNINVYKNTKAFNTQRYTNDPQPNDTKSAICSYTDAPGTFAATGLSGAQWTIQLPSACKISKKNGKKGVWFAVQADFDQAGGQWFWATQTTADRPNEEDWADTADLFQTPCTTFTAGAAGGGQNYDMQDCLGIAEPDFIMVLM